MALGAVSKYVFCPIASSNGPFCSGRVPSEYTPSAKGAVFLALGSKSVIWRQPLATACDMGIYFLKKAYAIFYK